MKMNCDNGWVFFFLEISGSGGYCLWGKLNELENILKIQLTKILTFS